MKHKKQLLLLEDVEGFGRSGDIVGVKPGFARNFLIPKKKAIIAQKHLIRFQEELKKKRSVQSEKDKKEAQLLTKKFESSILRTHVKIDAEGHMYGSVTAIDVVKFLKEQLNIELEKRNIALPKPIKKLGMHQIPLKLKEGVEGAVGLEVLPEEKAE